MERRGIVLKYTPREKRVYDIPENIPMERYGIEVYQWKKYYYTRITMERSRAQCKEGKMCSIPIEESIVLSNQWKLPILNAMEKESIVLKYTNGKEYDVESKQWKKYNVKCSPMEESINNEIYQWKEYSIEVYNGKYGIEVYQWGMILKYIQLKYGIVLYQWKEVVVLKYTNGSMVLINQWKEYDIEVYQWNGIVLKYTNGKV
ncbi:unnamed protein product [Mytilus edulis]|uniref:Uncharacterized protein n=1 Tax=Mytilus edulis TaxID=6550 RepID=A0A8S3SXW8_MYTED|nr:unnamed protein product [Mytilus edulis]